MNFAQAIDQTENLEIQNELAVRRWKKFFALNKKYV